MNIKCTRSPLLKSLSLLLALMTHAVVFSQTKNADVNPMTGRLLSVEQLQRQLERKKVESAIAQEELKRAGAEMELGLTQVRGHAEARKLSGDDFSVPATPTPAKSKPKKVNKPLASQAPLPAAVPQVAGPEVRALWRMGNQMMALLEQDGVSKTVMKGDTVFGYTVEGISDPYVNLSGGLKLKASTGAAVVTAVDRPMTGTQRVQSPQTPMGLVPGGMNEVPAPSGLVRLPSPALPPVPDLSGLMVR